MAGTRASLSISAPNEAWIKAQIDSGEFSSRSEVVNDLIRRAREIEHIRARLIASEESIARHGFSTKTPAQILARAKEGLPDNGNL